MYNEMKNNIIESLNSPFIMQLCCYFEDTYKMHFIMEHYKCGDLEDVLKRYGSLAEDVIKFLAAQITLAFEHMHNKNIIYRDMKPGNVLIKQNGYCIVCDFGISRIIEWNELSGTYDLYTPPYCAPELLNKKKYNTSVDWWTFGVTLFRLAFNKYPFTKSKFCSLEKNILEADPFEAVELEDLDISNEFLKFMKKLLIKNPKKRLGYNGVDEVKNHPWFDEIDFVKLARMLFIPILCIFFNDHHFM